MVTREEIIEKLENDIKDLDNKINNTQHYNEKNKLKRFIAKSGLALDYALPFIIATMITFYISKSNNKTPFIVDTIQENGSIEVIDSSTGIHKENIVYTNFEIDLIEHSTGWQMNEYGLYERTSTMYALNDRFNINNYEQILHMDRDELNSMFLEINCKIITEADKEKLDETYNEEVILLTRIVNSNISRNKQESASRNLLTTLVFMMISFILGKGLESVKKITFNTYIKDYFERYAFSCHEINEKEIEKLKEILEIKKENLSLIKESKKR